MWTSTSMTVTESLILSGMGLLTVLGALSALAVVIILFARVMEASNKKAQPAAPAAAPAPAPGISDETCAMIISVICEELQAAPEEINITSIKEI